MKRFFTEPTIDVKSFSYENIVTSSSQDIGTADETVTAQNAAVTLDLKNDLNIVF